jgi:linoleoyl-CoA desaturase
MKTEKVSFQKESTGSFYHTLKTRVTGMMYKENKSTSYIPGIKTFVLVSIYAVFLSSIYISLTPSAIIISYITLGALTTIIFLNVIHDAAHNALFKKASLNSLALRLLILFGADEYIWKKRHIISHHTYPNIPGKDVDIQQSSMIRIVPDAPFLGHHAMQPYYVPVLYLFYSLNWFLHRDFRDAFVNDKEFHISGFDKVKMVFKKLFYLFFTFLLPCYFAPSLATIYLTGFFLMHFTASIIGVMALTTAHVSEDSEFPKPGENKVMPDTWAVHQVRVTQDFATDNSIINHCFGGFNFHVAHHLFPSIPNRHYKEITKLIIITADEFGLKYKAKTLSSALRSHYELLKNNSRKPIEIDM